MTKGRRSHPSIQKASKQITKIKPAREWLEMHIMRHSKFLIQMTQEKGILTTLIDVDI